MIRLVQAEVRKVRSTRLWIGLGLGWSRPHRPRDPAAALAREHRPRPAVGRCTPVATAEDLRRLVFDAAGVLAFVLVLATTMATSEFRYGTAVGTYLATPSRLRVVTAKALAAAPIGFVYGAAAGLVVVLLAVGWLAAKGEPVPSGHSRDRRRRAGRPAGSLRRRSRGLFRRAGAQPTGRDPRAAGLAVPDRAARDRGPTGADEVGLPSPASTAPSAGRRIPVSCLSGRRGALALGAAYVALLWGSAVWAERAS